MSGREVHLEIEPGSRVPAYAAIPSEARRGVVVIHELLGRQPEIDRVVDRFFAAGYAAIAPDLLTRAPKPICIARMMRASATGEGEPVRETLAAREWLTAASGLSAPAIGLIGFCIGGGFALGIGRGWGAVSANYGVLPPAERLQGLGPVIACYGGRDRLFGRYAAPLREALQTLGVESEVHVFPEVGHSFLTDGDHPIAFTLTRPLMQIRFDRVVAEEGWRRIFAFFDRHLKIDHLR